MPGTQSENADNSQPTVAGCLLMVLSLGVIAFVALPVVRWRDPEFGQPLPRMLAIAVPLLAGALCYAVGTGILRILGLRVLVEPKKKPSDHPEDLDTRARERQTPD